MGQTTTLAQPFVKRTDICSSKNSVAGCFASVRFLMEHAVTRQGVEVVQLTTRFPRDIVDWLAAKAAVNLSNKNSELVRICREMMARDKAKA
jgi:hypothetical protein